MELVAAVLNFENWKEGFFVYLKELSYFVFSPSVVVSSFIFFGILYFALYKINFEKISKRGNLILKFFIFLLPFIPIPLYVAMCTRGRINTEPFTMIYYYLPTATLIFLVLVYALYLIQDQKVLRVLHFLLPLCFLVNVYSLQGYLQKNGVLSQSAVPSTTNSLIQTLSDRDLAKVPPLTEKNKKNGYLLSDPQGYFLRALLKNEWPACHIFLCAEENENEKEN